MYSRLLGMNRVLCFHSFYYFIFLILYLHTAFEETLSSLSN
jgi:hypothetical protein